MERVGLVEGYRRGLGAADDYSLTRRESEVLMLVAQGKRNKDIAKALDISICTVKIHLSNVFLKLGVTRRGDAVKAAWQQGELGSHTKRLAV